MDINPELQEQIYREIGQEMSRRQYHPGPMARAVAEASGNKAVAESLYVKFRFEEIVRQHQREEARRREAETPDREKGVYKCGKCGFHGKPKRVPRGDFGVLIMLTLLCVVPGFIYGVAYEGYRGVCPTCGEPLVDRL